MDNIRTSVDNDQFAEHSGIQLVEVRKGSAKAEMTVEEKHLNGLGLPHGGAVFTLADLAFAAACNSHGVDAVAVNINISFFKTAKIGQKLTAVASEVSISRKLGTYSINVFSDDNTHIASMQGTAFRKTSE